MPTDYVGGDLSLANKLRTVSRRTEKMLQGNKRNRISTIHWSIHPQKEQNETKNVAIAWIDLKTVYEMVLQSLIINCLKTYKISDQVIKFIEKALKNWRVDWLQEEEGLTEVKIQRGIFQVDVLSPLQLVIGMMLLNHLLRKCTGRYKAHKSPEKNQSPNVHGWHQTVC